jgi:hypothetical protein
MYLVVFEASLFGSGQMLHVGGVTLKMLLFVLSQIYLFISLFWGDKFARSTLLLLTSLGCVIGIAGWIGFVRGADGNLILEDTTPLLYFLMLPFFELTIRTKGEVVTVIRIIFASSLAMCAGYAIMLGALWRGLVSPLDLYTLLTNVGNGDFMYDGLTWRVFYKGSLYLAIGVILFAFGKGRWARMGLIVSFVFLVLTVTRGFLLALFLVILLYALIRPAPHVTKIAYSIVLLICGFLGLYATFGLVGPRTESDSVRLTTISQVADRITPLTLIVGNGFGVGVPERPEHMEIAYLELLHKQGLIGLAWNGALGMLLAMRFRRAVKSGSQRLAYGLFLSGVFVFLESLTNPFINNPIGMSAVLICLAGLRALANSASGLTNRTEAPIG